MRRVSGSKFLLDTIMPGHAQGSRTHQVIKKKVWWNFPSYSTDLKKYYRIMLISSESLLHLTKIFTTLNRVIFEVCVLLMGHFRSYCANISTVK